jgi:fructose-1,6-bisphosphatase/inositol monophosphatase family enzyme
VNDDALLRVLDEAAGAVRDALTPYVDWRAGGDRPGQYRLDLVADAAAVPVLVGAGFGVLSEESGVHHPEREIRVVIDPVDGSTNASCRIPWYATSACAVDRTGLLAAMVVNQSTGERFAALRGGGAECDGVSVTPSACAALPDAIIGLAGLPGGPLGARQARAFGAAALDLCYVAAGRLDGYLSCTALPHHGPWDYLGALLVCREAGAVMADRFGQDLESLEWEARRSPVAAATPSLLADLLEVPAAAA